MSDPLAEPAVSLVDGEPVALSQALTVLLSAAVTAGWVTIPDPTVNALATLLALVITTVSTLRARSKVTPVAKL